MKKKIIIGLILLCLIAGGSYYYLNSHQEEEITSSTKTMPINKGPIKQTIFSDGMVSSKTAVNIYAPVSSSIKAVMVNEGDHIKAGDTLLTLDTRDLETSLKSAEKTLEDDLNALNNLMAKGNKTTNASYQKALNAYNQAKADYASDQELFKSGIISQIALKNSQASLDNAYVSYLSAKDNLTSSDTGASIASLEAKIEIDRLNIEAIKEDIASAQITSPINGTVVSGLEDIYKNINKGEMLFIVEDLSDLQVEASISEYDVTYIELGQTVLIEMLGYDTLYHGVISSIAPKGQINGTEVIVPITIDITDEDEAIKVNYTANLEIVVAEKNEAFIVPYDALIDSPKGSFVTVIRNGEEIMVPVKIGITSDLYIEIISESLKPSDEIIVNSLSSLTEESERGMGLPGMNKMPGGMQRPAGGSDN